MRKYEIRKMKKDATSGEVEGSFFLKIARPGWGESKRRGGKNDGEGL
ncbi:hypothetical protein [Bacillus sp. MB353a]|nr:hypothetical protein [Bacillus sp. MB353a]